MSLFGAAAPLLSAVGIYGVFSCHQPAHARDRHPHGARPIGSIRNQVLAEGRG
jgi:hypothetical protein